MVLKLIERDESVVVSGNDLTIEKCVWCEVLTFDCNRRELVGEKVRWAMTTA